MSKAIEPSTSMMIVFFSCNALMWIFFQFVSHFERKMQPSEDSDIVKKSDKKELSKPFTPSLEGFKCLTHDLLKLGFIMGLTYVCENHWIFPHSQKEYSRDLFMFIVLLFFLYGIYTLKPVKDLTLLSRDQTEEWKGWMQFIFLLYHCKFLLLTVLRMNKYQWCAVICCGSCLCRFPCGGGVQLCPHHDHLLCVDDWLW